MIDHTADRSAARPDTDDMSPIIVERTGAVAVIWFNRPSRRNAFDETLMQHLAATLKNFARSWPECRVIVFAGRGQNFGAGGDVEMLSRPKTSVETYDLRNSLTAIYELIQDGPQICIAAVHGHCVGSAFVLAGCCDFRICAESAKFLLPEINFGQLPGIGVGRIACTVNDRMLRRLLILGQECSAREACLDGFVTEVVADDNLMLAVLDLARLIVAKAPDALRHAKRLAIHARAGHPSIVLDYERLANQSLTSDETQSRLRDVAARKGAARKD